MEDLAARYADRAVRSVFIYTREAHPGENHRHHTTMADKRDRARAFKEHTQARRSILLDDLEGTCHRAYGTLPNMTWIMGRGGIVLYKAAWTGVDDIEDALATGLDAHARRAKDKLVGFHAERLAWRVNDSDAFRAGLERAGPQAVTDFFGKSAKDAAD